jgi:hypothetical protein
LNAGLSAGIHAAGGLIQDQDGRIREHGSGDGEELRLPLAEVAGTLRWHGLIDLGQPTNEMVGVRDSGRPHDLLIRGIQATEADVLHDRGGEQESVLQHHPELAAQVGGFEKPGSSAGGRRRGGAGTTLPAPFLTIDVSFSH